VTNLIGACEFIQRRGKGQEDKGTRGLPPISPSPCLPFLFSPVSSSPHPGRGKEIIEKSFVKVLDIIVVLAVNIVKLEFIGA
jgi:hypothetical protein